MEGIHQYTESGLDMIMNGEIGRYEMTRFVEQTVVHTGGAANDSTFDAFADAGAAWTASGAGDWAFFFGADTICEAIHTPEEIRAKIPDDYGRSKGLAWYALVGYALSHGLGGTSTEATQCRILKFDSAV